MSSLSLSTEPNGAPVTERLLDEAEAAFAELSKMSTAARLAAARCGATVRRLQEHADQVGAVAGQQLVRVRRLPARDPVTGKRVKHARRGRPKGARNGNRGVLLLATEQQIEELRARLQEPGREAAQGSLP